jgi:hypothetical protein
MVARLGYVLYWVGCGFAALFPLGALLAVWIVIADYSIDTFSSISGAVLLILAAVLSWGIGKWLRYILAGNYYWRRPSDPAHVKTKSKK